MEKYGCNRLEDIKARIRELESTKFKTASVFEELDDLKAMKVDLEREVHEDGHWDAKGSPDYYSLVEEDL